MRTCIWCKRSEVDCTFRKIAHTVPKSLGGKNICSEVCDECNAYFGNHQQKTPPIETVFKEAFNITRAKLLHANGMLGRNKPMVKFESIYFKVDFEKHKLSLKLAYRSQKDFQEKLGRQLKRGIYKVFLEEYHRQKGGGMDAKYDFIRDFARYDIGDYPVFYFQRTHGVILIVKDWIANPEFIMSEDARFKYLLEDNNFVEFEFMGHVFGIVKTRSWVDFFKVYANESVSTKFSLFNSCRTVRTFEDVDFTLSILNSK